MPKKTLTILGILLILVQILGVLSVWKVTFGVIVGVYLVFIAMRGITDKEIKEPEIENEINRNSINDGAKETEIGN